MDNVGDVFLTFLLFQRLFRVFRLLQVTQKHTLGEMGTWMVV